LEQTKTIWSIPAAELLKSLGASAEGLTEQESKQRLETYGRNTLAPGGQKNLVVLWLSQYKSPIILILIFAAILSFFLRDETDALLILIIVFISGILGFWQEYSAGKAMKQLLKMVQPTTEVLRDGRQKEIPPGEIVPGDIILLSAGSSIPADCRLLESRDLIVNEATLTGETYPVDKAVDVLPADTTLAKRANLVFTGTFVVSGTGKALAVNTGKNTELGKISEHLNLRPPQTEFESGVRRFGFFLIEVTLLLIIAIFGINVYLNRPVLDAFLFSLALAVGLTPQLLPAIITVNLAKGAKKMAENKVIVKRLVSIENFGSMNVLCTDKTGTITSGNITLSSFCDANGNENKKILQYACINSYFETGFTNPVDQAIRRHSQLDVGRFTKLDEEPYDFVRKRLSILVSDGVNNILVTKGALQNILQICSAAELADGTIKNISELEPAVQERYQYLSSQGYRVLGIAYRNIGAVSRISVEQESDMIFLGLLCFSDPPKEHMPDVVRQLKQSGVSLKIITGDNKYVAANVAKQIGLAASKVITGSEIRSISDAALPKVVSKSTVFAEIEPNQKERLILALKKSGNVTGFMGDGVNDASALHAADVGISVDSAADVAKEAADIVLLEKDLGVLMEGVKQGRATFANTLKYVFMATSANFGNMFSMAGASLFLPYLPLLPKQILLVNLLTDFPEMTIATDSVDDELVNRPRRWNIKFIRKFMVVFGLLSSFFDLLTFAAFLLLLHAGPEQLRTGWFIESIISAAVIVMIIRTRKPFFKSKPGKYLSIATLITIAVSMAVPFSPVAQLFNFVPLPVTYFAAIAAIVLMYVIMAEVVKRWFYKKAQQ
jgi:Mg2+-importing ATPase